MNPDQPEFFPPSATKDDRYVNPCVRLFGPGPAGVKCKACKHLEYHQPSKKRFYKCYYRPFSRGAATDHKFNWSACAKFEKRPPEPKEESLASAGALLAVLILIVLPVVIMFIARNTEERRSPAPMPSDVNSIYRSVPLATNQTRTIQTSL